MNPKTQQRLEALLTAFDSGAVSPEELVKVTEALLSVIKDLKSQIDSRISELSDDTSSKSEILISELNTKAQRLETLIQENEAKNTSRTNTLEKSVTTQLSKEIKKLEGKIPQKTDLTDIINEIDEIRKSLPDFANLLTQEPEAIRDSLELIEAEEDKLAITAIGNLRKELDDLDRKAKEKNSGGAIIARRIDQIGDVSLTNLTDNDTLVYNSTTHLWENGTSGGVSKNTVREMAWNNGSTTTPNTLTVSATEPVNSKEGDLWVDIA